MSSTSRMVARFALPLAALAVGAGIALVLIKTPQRAKRARHGPKPPLVEVTKMRPEKKRVEVIAMGTVIPARQIDLRSEVSGRVVAVSSELVPGGRVEQGSLLVRVDPREYRLAAEQQEASVERAEFELAVEQGRQRVAKREWNLIGDGAKTSEEGRALALREPHLKTANVAVKAARSGLERAQLNVSRTTVVAPFNAFVQDELIDVGQLVTPQTRLGSLVGTDEFWVQVSVPVGRLAWFAIPGVNGDEGASVQITQELGSGMRIERRGRVIRLLGDLDPRGRMARVLVEIDDPFGLESSGSRGGLPLLIGAYVEVTIEGRELDEIFVIPRVALRDEATVWVVDSEDRLEFRPVTVAWRDRSEVFVSEGLRAGERVVTTRLTAPVERMKLRTQDEAPASRESPTAQADTAPDGTRLDAKELP